MAVVIIWMRRWCGNMVFIKYFAFVFFEWRWTWSDGLFCFIIPHHLSSLLKSYISTNMNRKKKCVKIVISVKIVVSFSQICHSTLFVYTKISFDIYKKSICFPMPCHQEFFLYFILLSFASIIMTMLDDEFFFLFSLFFVLEPFVI